MLIIAIVSAWPNASHSANTTISKTEINRLYRLEAIKKLGGYVLSRPTGRCFSVANFQKLIQESELEDICSEISRATTIAVNILTTNDVQNTDCGVLILVDELNVPTLSIQPEDFKSTLNVRRLCSDSPNQAVLRKRFRKEFWRAFCMALGAGTSSFQPCLMTPISSISELDQISLSAPCPEVFDKIQRAADKYKFGRYRRVTYKTACKEGWAPAPTNDIQKAIWDKVHAMPTEPIKIKPETKKVEK
ncbi:MAG: hypothetical protein KBT45_06270 [Bacteroidales bacterium]|nr:hypothetical protein [Candidatus Colimorpha pelethequi]